MNRFIISATAIAIGCILVIAFITIMAGSVAGENADPLARFLILAACLLGAGNAFAVLVYVYKNKTEREWEMSQTPKKGR